jgi:multiple antibiotic resistance protein
MKYNQWESFLLLLSTIGPLRVTIACAHLTADATPEQRKRIAARAVLIASAVCLVFAVLGEAILNVFNVSVPAFQIAGGIIVALFSLEMVVGNKQPGTLSGDPANHERALAEDLAVTPLAIPLMASVSGLVAIVSLLPRDNDIRATLILCAAIIAIMGLDYVCLRSCGLIVKALGPTALDVTSKILGVILTALAVELVLMGLNGLGLLATPRPGSG